ncbi:XPG domain containing-domain-containing protein [Xylariomycetidae sp. FL0641]|nr:XPG domain containing-domain-containing protein [Xylariomycetidae sp. FL0641]
MGIRGLGPAITRYASLVPLSGDTVVIDGPALAHRIYDRCLTHRPAKCGFICHPPYGLVGRMVIGWLEELRRHNVNVRKIYFDGYLPPSKWGVRRDRLLQQSVKMKDLMVFNPLGSLPSPIDAYSHLKDGQILFRSVGRSVGPFGPPKSSFLIPAVLEALQQSPYWGPRIQVVPGEADLFCAEDVLQNGGVVLTSDSDLLIKDLGKGGSMAFFGDVVPVDPSSPARGMLAAKVSLHEINNQLGISNTGGLPRLAFEMVRGRLRFPTALTQAKSIRQEALDTPEFLAFMKEHAMKDYIRGDHPVLGILTTLDPRISEIVLQSLLMEVQGDIPDPEKERGPETLSMFLPIMIENRDRKSSWTMSTSVRQIAYSVLQESASHRSSDVVEYRTLDSESSVAGRQIPIPTLAEAVEQCDVLVRTLHTLFDKLSSPELEWFAFTICQEVDHTLFESRPSSAAALIQQIVNQREEPSEHSWDLLHFSAQVQASFYSLRMAKQLLDVASFLGQDLPAPIQQLRQYLGTLPSISEWPTVDGMPTLLAKFNEANGLALIAEVLGVPSIEAGLEEPSVTTSTSPNYSTSSEKKRKRGPIPGTPDIAGSGRSPSVNPFAILSQACED